MWWGSLQINVREQVEKCRGMGDRPSYFVYFSNRGQIIETLNKIVKIDHYGGCWNNRKDPVPSNDNKGHKKSE
jgi:hypothetical protein